VLKNQVQYLGVLRKGEAVKAVKKLSAEKLPTSVPDPQGKGGAEKRPPRVVEEKKRKKGIHGPQNRNNRSRGNSEGMGLGVKAGLGILGERTT